MFKCVHLRGTMNFFKIQCFFSLQMFRGNMHNIVATMEVANDSSNDVYGNAPLVW